jgi:hypothetical protein
VKTNKNVRINKTIEKIVIAKLPFTFGSFKVGFGGYKSNSSIHFKGLKLLGSGKTLPFIKRKRFTHQL